MLVMNFVDTGGRRLGFDHEWYWVTYLTEIAAAIVVGWLFYLSIERHFISSRQKRRAELELSEQTRPAVTEFQAEGLVIKP
jgi:hypothetical protein